MGGLGKNAKIHVFPIVNQVKN